MIVLAGLMGASGIILAAAAAHTAPGAGLDSAAYMLLFHATAVLSGTVLLQQGLLLRPMMLSRRVGTWQCSVLRRHRVTRFRRASAICTGSADRRHHSHNCLVRTCSCCHRGFGAGLILLDE